MAKKESENIAADIHQLEKDISFYRTELFSTRPAEYVYEVRKLLAKAEERRRQLISKMHEAKRKEGIIEKNNKLKTK